MCGVPALSLRPLRPLTLAALATDAKPNTDAVCGMACPMCKANPGCLKGFEHFGQTEHFCMNCGHVWGP